LILSPGPTCSSPPSARMATDLVTDAG